MSEREDYLDHVSSFVSQMPGLVGLKNDKSVFLSANEHALCLFGFNRLDQLVHRKDDDLNCPAAKFSEGFRQEDQQVMAQQEKVSFLNIIQYADQQWHVLVTEKSPVLFQGACVGVFFKKHFIDDPRVLQASQILQSRFISVMADCPHQQSYLIGDPNLTSLTQREQECLFFTLYGKSCKQIAKILAISHRTVEAHLDKLKSKFNCSNKSELINETMTRGYLSVIPKSLFNQQLSIQLKHA